MLRLGRRLLIACVFIAVTPKWAETCTDLTLIEFPESTTEIGRGERRVLRCATSDPSVYVAWYRSSQGQIVMWRVTAWSRQNASYELRNASSTHDGLYVCKIDTDRVAQPVQSYSFELKVVEGRGVVGGTGAPATTAATRRPTRTASATMGPTLEGTRQTVKPTEEGASSKSEDSNLAIPLLIGVVVLQLVCLSVILVILITYYRSSPEEKLEPLKKQTSVFVDIERAPNGESGGTVHFRTVDNDDRVGRAVATTTTGNRTFKLRSKSMHARKRHAPDDVIELDFKKKSLTTKKKKDKAAPTSTGKPPLLRKSKSTVTRPSSKISIRSDDEDDLSPSIVPLGKTRSFSLREKNAFDEADAGGFLPFAPDASSIGPLINDPEGEAIQWDTYHSLMESMTSIDMKQEKVKAGLGKPQQPRTKKKKHEKKKAKKSEIDAMMQDEEYWEEVRQSTPKRVRSSRMRGYPGAARRVGSGDTPFAPPETSIPMYQRRHSVDARGGGDFERFPTGKAARVLINPAIQEDITNFTPNLVRRLKNMYDQGITTIEIT